eukprot:g1589.t1
MNETRPASLIEISDSIGENAGKTDFVNDSNKSAEKVSESVELATVRSDDNPMPQELAPPSFATKGTNGDRLVIVMVGLPARGKTYMANRITRYLTFFHGATAEVFNVGNYRRKLNGAKALHNFFDAKNEDAMAVRLKCAELAMADLKQFLQSGKDLGRVAIYDATNTTRERRHWITTQVRPLLEKDSQIIFVESICDNERMVETNVTKVKMTMPDYEGMAGDSIMKDFKQRIQHYKDIYEPLDLKMDEKASWIKIRNAGHNIQMNRIGGYLAARITKFLMNLHCVERPIYLSRHGRSKYNELGKIGGDSGLSEEGVQYSKVLSEFCADNLLKTNKYTRLWTSSLKRTKETAKHIPHHVLDDGWISMRHRVWRALDELYAGSFDGMTYEEIQAKAPREYAMRKKDKLRYRYPRGESYLDVIARLEPVVLELERQEDPVLIIAHQGIHRMLYAYFKGMPRKDAPFVSIPLNTVIKLTPGAYTCDEERMQLIPPKKHISSDPPSH